MIDRHLTADASTVQRACDALRLGQTLELEVPRDGIIQKWRGHVTSIIRLADHFQIEMYRE